MSSEAQSASLRYLGGFSGFIANRWSQCAVITALTCCFHSRKFFSSCQRESVCESKIRELNWAFSMPVLEFFLADWGCDCFTRGREGGSSRDSAITEKQALTQALDTMKDFDTRGKSVSENREWERERKLRELETENFIDMKKWGITTVVSLLIDSNNWDRCNCL